MLIKCTVILKGVSKLINTVNISMILINKCVNYGGSVDINSVH